MGSLGEGGEDFLPHHLILPPSDVDVGAFVQEFLRWLIRFSQWKRLSRPRWLRVEQWKFLRRSGRRQERETKSIIFGPVMGFGRLSSKSEGGRQNIFSLGTIWKSLLKSAKSAAPRQLAISFGCCCDGAGPRPGSPSTPVTPSHS